MAGELAAEGWGISKIWVRNGGVGFLGTGGAYWANFAQGMARVFSQYLGQSYISPLEEIAQISNFLGHFWMNQ